MKAFIKRVFFAYQGWISFFRTDANGQIQFIIAFAVIIAAFLLKVSAIEWMILLACIGVVISLEMMNSAIEKICDHVTPELHPMIKLVKDVAAGAVLWTAVAAAIIGLIIFVPKLLSLGQALSLHN